ncbi:redox-sensing transcriptional repressor Rex [Pseudonocardia sp. NPDC046786]|uniref:redox-sensing transcriptional repressor Rex n=1 Tax=Pseudonocardia sp. NPDC046786 TaxID=3155471 RepID=UPI0033CE54A4
MSLPPDPGVPSVPETDGERPVRPVPEATVSRLAVYLRVLGELREQGVETVSSEELAGASGVNSAKLRKDLSYLGSYGVRGVGYDVASLQGRLQGELGMDHRQSVALVGVGNLGHALAGYAGFAGRGFPVSALFDVEPDLVGIDINGIRVRHVREIPDVCAAHGVTIGMIATPGPAAQNVCDLLVGGGVQSILNFAPVLLQVPDDVEVRKVDLSVELQVLAFHVARRHIAGDVTVPGDPPDGAVGATGETNGSVVSPR